jgi:hypothetical protein
MVQSRQHFTDMSFQNLKIYQQAGGVKLLTADRHFHPPVVTMQAAAFAVIFRQAVRRFKLLADRQFIHLLFTLLSPNLFGDLLTQHIVLGERTNHFVVGQRP